MSNIFGPIFYINTFSRLLWTVLLRCSAEPSFMHQQAVLILSIRTIYMSLYFIWLDG